MKDRIEKIEIEGENKSGDIFGIWGSAWKEMREIFYSFSVYLFVEERQKLKGFVP